MMRSVKGMADGATPKSTPFTRIHRKQRHPVFGVIDNNSDYIPVVVSIDKINAANVIPDSDRGPATIYSVPLNLNEACLMPKGQFIFYLPKKLLKMGL